MKRFLIPLSCVALLAALAGVDWGAGSGESIVSTDQRSGHRRVAAASGDRSISGFDEGASNADLVFTPVTPCRVFDTRNHPQGKLTNGAERVFFVATDDVDPDLRFQGGNQNGCGVPYGSATSVVVALTAIPDGTGFMRAWATGGALSTAAQLNYSSALNATNTTTVPICDPGSDPSGCGSGDLTLQAFGASTHVLGDVTGYFSFSLPPSLVKSEVEGFTVSAAHAVTASCTRVGGVSATMTPAWSGDIVVEGEAVVSIDHVSGTADEVRLYVGYGVSNGEGDSVTDGCLSAGSACQSSSVAFVPSEHATTSDHLVTVPVRCRIPVLGDAPGDPGFAGHEFTISLWARSITGAGSDTVEQARLDATLTPDDEGFVS